MDKSAVTKDSTAADRSGAVGRRIPGRLSPTAPIHLLDQGLSPDSMLVTTIKTEGLGLLVISGQLRILYANDHAPGLLLRLRALQSGTSDETTTGSELPSSIQVLCEEVQQVLVDRVEQGDWCPFELSRTVGTVNDSMLVRAFVFPSRASLIHSRLLVTMQTL